MWYRLASNDTDKPVYAELYCCGGITKKDFNLLAHYGVWLGKNGIDDTVCIGLWENEELTTFADITVVSDDVWLTIGTLDHLMSRRNYKRKVGECNV